MLSRTTWISELRDLPERSDLIQIRCAVHLSLASCMQLSLVVTSCRCLAQVSRDDELVQSCLHKSSSTRIHNSTFGSC